MTPQRIQRKRTKGWRLPPNTVYVGRPTQWSNPYRVGHRFALQHVRKGHKADQPVLLDLEQAVELFRQRVVLWPTEWRAELRGKNLACWCPLVDADGNPVPCHGDVLLAWANEGEA